MSQSTESGPADLLSCMQTVFGCGDAKALTSLIVEQVRQRDSREAVAALVDFALAPRAAAIDATSRTPLEREFLRAMVRASQRLAYRNSHKTVAPLDCLQVAERCTDVLAHDTPFSSWTVAQWLTTLSLRGTPPARRAAVVVTMRDDGLSALEWIAHYRALGFETVFVYSNDNVDGSDDLLRILAEHGAIIFIDNQIDYHFSPQRKAYAHAIHLLPEIWEHEWVLFVDSDEFFVPASRYDCNIDALLDDVTERFPVRRPSAICFNWRWYVSGGLYGYDPDLLLRRFKHATNHHLAKCLVRPRDILSMREIHFPDLISGGFLVKSDFTKIDYAQRWETSAPVYVSGQINHYWTKSFEEFSIKKFRGDSPGMVDHGYSRDFELFFQWNAPETEANLMAPPEDLIARVDAEMRYLATLKGVKEHVYEINRRLPHLLARYDNIGGLSEVYSNSLNAAHINWTPRNFDDMKIRQAKDGFTYDDVDWDPPTVEGHPEDPWYLGPPPRK